MGALMESSGGAHDLGAAMPFSDLPLVGDLDQDGHMEILTEAGTGGLLKALDDKGKEIGGAWPLELGVKSFGKVMADLDLDGSMEIILLSADSRRKFFCNLTQTVDLFVPMVRCGVPGMWVRVNMRWIRWSYVLLWLIWMKIRRLKS